MEMPKRFDALKGCLIHGKFLLLFLLHVSISHSSTLLCFSKFLKNAIGITVFLNVWLMHLTPRHNLLNERYLSLRVKRNPCKVPSYADCMV